MDIILYPYLAQDMGYYIISKNLGYLTPLPDIALLIVQTFSGGHPIAGGHSARDRFDEKHQFRGARSPKASSQAENVEKGQLGGRPGSHHCRHRRATNARTETRY